MYLTDSFSITYILGLPKSLLGHITMTLEVGQGHRFHFQNHFPVLVNVQLLSHHSWDLDILHVCDITTLRPGHSAQSSWLYQELLLLGKLPIDYDPEQLSRSQSPNCDCISSWNPHVHT